LKNKDLQEYQKAILIEKCQNTAIGISENTTFEHEHQEVISVCRGPPCDKLLPRWRPSFGTQ
jgi:hypothetical protein